MTPNPRKPLKPRHPDPEGVRLGVAEDLIRLAQDPRWRRRPKVREEFLRMARAWARTLPDGPEKDRIMSLDERRGKL